MSSLQSKRCVAQGQGATAGSGCRRLLMPAAIILWIVVLWIFLCSAGALAAQEESSPDIEDDPSQDIFIEGIGFSKLILEIRRNADLEQYETYGRFMPVLERNLCWSGLFSLYGGDTHHCKLRGDPSRVDMRVSFMRRETGLRVRLQDAGVEGLVLYDEVLAMDRWITEKSVIRLVNNIAERITGRPGLLGSTIAFVLRQPGFAKLVVATDTHARALKQISTNSEINLLPHWSPDGEALVYTILGRNGSAVFYHNLVRPADQLMKSRFLTARTGLNTGGAFSRGGERVAFTMSRNGTADLYQYDFSKKQLKQLTFREGIETSADWSPDNKEIVFVSDRSGRPQVYLLDLVTGEDLRLTFDSTYNADPKWSPDGESILFTKRVNRRDQIHIMDKFGENVRAVTSGRYDAEQASWSPDGKQIVFTSNRTGEFKLYIVSTDGSNLRRLTRTQAEFEETNPAWNARRFEW